MTSLTDLTDQVYRYYPKGVGLYNGTYRETQENKLLVATLRSAMADLRWEHFKAAVKDVARITLTDLSSYSLANTCFTASMRYETGGFTYYIKTYVGILAPIWSWKAECAFEPDFQANQSKTTKQELAATLQNLQRQESAFKNNNPVAVNLQAADFRLFIGQLVDIQNAVFGYVLLPDAVGQMIIPDIEKPGKDFGTVTLFDCLLSDLNF